MRLKSERRSAGGEWAVVTGAAGGIGLAIARNLREFGYNLALADIDGEGLLRAAAELEAKNGGRVKYVCLDLSKRESAEQFCDWCVRENVTPLILVNNAGMFSYNDVLSTGTAKIETMVGLHVLTVALLCRLLGEVMARQGRGYILNVSSYSLWMPWPGLALYSATKSFIRNFSRAFAAEVSDRGVSVTAVLPAGVTTGLYGLSPKWQNIGRRLGFLITPEKTSKLAVEAMFRGRRQYVPGFLMWLMLPLVKNLPGWCLSLARRKTLRFQK